MDEVWALFNETDGKAYVARAEEPTVLCSFAPSATAALNKMGGLISQYKNPYPIGSSVTYDFDSQNWNVTLIINHEEDDE